VSITKVTDSASAKLMTSTAGGLGGPGGPPSNEKLYQQTLNLLMGADRQGVPVLIHCINMREARTHIDRECGATASNKGRRVRALRAKMY
jgi:hypothetical protein